MSNQFSEFAAGDFLFFGSYYNGKYTKSPIKWKVLEKTKDSLLIVSDNLLSSGYYYYPDDNSTWADSSVRRWLNNDFYNSAFSDDEKMLVIRSVVSPDKNRFYDSNSGRETEDFVFLLSTEEIERYFKSDEDRICMPTEYTMMMNSPSFSTNYTAKGSNLWWWTRTPGEVNSLAAYVDDSGKIVYSGHPVGLQKNCIRPALQLNIL